TWLCRHRMLSSTTPHRTLTGKSSRPLPRAARRRAGVGRATGAGRPLLGGGWARPSGRAQPRGGWAAGWGMAVPGECKGKWGNARRLPFKRPLGERNRKIAPIAPGRPIFACILGEDRFSSWRNPFRAFFLRAAHPAPEAEAVLACDWILW